MVWGHAPTHPKKEIQAREINAENQDPGIKQMTDDLLDEIDNLLEDQGFLATYRQKGGE